MGSMLSTRGTRAGIRVRNRRQHRRRSHDEEHPEQHRVQCHDHPWKRHRTVNFSHLERRQQNHPPFAESHEVNWTAEQPGHRQGGGEYPSLDEEGEEMVADGVKKGSIPIRLVNQAQTEE